MKPSNLMCLIVMMFTVFAHAATFYVSPNGLDSNSGSESKPWKTIQHAAETLVNGDQVFIKAGTYMERIIPQHSGTSDQEIIYSANPGDEVIIDGSNITLSEYWGGLIDITGKSFITVSGLTIINAGPHDNNVGILVDNSSFITIADNHTINTTSSGIGVWQSSNITIENNEIELACNDGEQECLTVATTSNFIVSDNYVHNGGPGSIGGEGIDIKDGSFNGKVYRNTVENIPKKLGIYVEAWDKHTHSIDVYCNTIFNCGGDGITLASEQGGLLENINVFNNIIYGNKNIGIMITPNGDVAEPPMKDIKIINNTIYNNGWDSWGGGIGSDNPNLSNLIIRNNIASQNLHFQIAIEHCGENFIIDHNLIDGFRGELEEEIHGEHFVESTALFINADNFDFRLQANSPAIDKGSMQNAPDFDFAWQSRPQGAGIDIGAFEHSITQVEKRMTKERIKSFSLKIYPNPFNPTATIEYAVTKPEKIRISIYNLLGKHVVTLFDNYHTTGTFSTTWDATDLTGIPVTNGIYFCTLQSKTLSKTQQILYIK